jgi:hypothetical protein
MHKEVDECAECGCIAVCCDDCDCCEDCCDCGSIEEEGEEL